MLLHNTDSSISQMYQGLPHAKPVADTGLVENFKYAADLSFLQANSMGKFLSSDIQWAQTQKLMQMREAGAIPEEVFEQFTYEMDDEVVTDWGLVGDYAKDVLGLGVYSQKEIKGMIRQNIIDLRDKTQDVRDRATWGGVLGYTGGLIGGSMADPLLLPTFFIGLGPTAHAVKTVARLNGLTKFKAIGSGALKTGAKLGAIETSFETLRQPTIYSFQDEIGLDYSFKDAMGVIMSTAVGSAVLGTSVSALGIGLSAMIKKNKMKGNMASKASENSIESTIRDLKSLPEDADALTELEKVETEIVYQQQVKISEGMELVAKADEEIDAAFAKVIEDNPEIRVPRSDDIDETVTAVQEIEDQIARAEGADDVLAQMDTGKGIDELKYPEGYEDYFKEELSGRKPNDQRDFLKKMKDQSAFNIKNAKVAAAIHQSNIDYVFKRREVAKAAGEIKGVTDKKLLRMQRNAVKSAGEELMSGLSAEGKNVPLDQLSKTIENMMHSRWEGAMRAHRVRNFGFAWDKVGQENMIYDMYKLGSSGDEQAKLYASIYKTITDDLRQMYIDAGGPIEYLADWYLPVMWDGNKIARATKAEFIYDMLRLANKKRLSFNRELTEIEQKNLLGDIYDNLTSDGLVELPDASLNPYAKRSRSKYHMHHRVLHFENADNWLAATDKYGPTKPYDSMKRYIEMMSRDIAAMRKFGHNPDRAVAQLAKHMIDVTKDKSVANNMMASYRDIMGQSLGYNTNVAEILSSARSISGGIKIVGGALTAMSDTMFGGIYSYMFDIPVFKFYRSYFKNLVGGGVANKRLVHQLGIDSSYAADAVKTGWRIASAEQYDAASRFMDATVRLSGLHHVTYAGKVAFQREFMAELTRKVQKLDWNDISGRYKRFVLSRTDIDEDLWNTLKDTPIMTKDGVEFIDLRTIKDVDKLSRVTGLIRELTTYAVPEPTSNIRAAMTGGLPAGTLWGETARTLGHFKTFPVTILINTFRRGMEIDNTMSRMGFFGATLALPTALGIFIVSAKDILAGKTPPDWNIDLMKRAFLQGGGAGMIGDFLMADPNRVGSMYGVIAGPLVSDAEQLGRAVLPLLYGEPNKVKTRLARLAGKNIPFQFPYLGVGLRRYWEATVMKAADPNWASKNMAMRKRLMKDRGQTEWWPVGSTKPGFTQGPSTREKTGMIDF